MEKKNTILYHPLSEEGKERWLFASGLNDMKTSGCYVVRLRHGAGGYGLPLENCGNSHYVVATLFVTDSGSDERLQVNRVLGQTIILPSCNDATTRIFSRTLSKRNSTSMWSNWDSVATQSELEQHIKSQTDTEVAWGASSHIDTLIAPGVYNIKGERLNANDGLPIANSSPGHTIAAKLLVLDSSISGTGDSQDKCITQILMLSNRTGSDGNVYMRTGSAASKNTLNGGYGWSSWGKLQQNIEVGQVTSLNSFIGNGIYSGVYTNGTSFFETFVMVVINNYAVAGAAGKVRSISQFKYALGVDGSFSYKTRVGQGNTGISWGEWTYIDKNALHAVEEEKARAQRAEAELQAGISSLVAGTVPNGAITAEKLSAEVRDKIERIQEIEENHVKEKTALINGDTIVGQAREVYSRQGKIDTATFLKRTTAGGTSVSDGIASVKKIGGNIIKNIIGDISKPIVSPRYNITHSNGIYVIKADDTLVGSTAATSYAGYVSRVFASGHIYYVKTECYSEAGRSITLVLGYNGYSSRGHMKKLGELSAGKWTCLSRRIELTADSMENYFCIYPFGSGTALVTADGLYVRGGINIIDLTEMYGAGNEPSQDECDRMFGTMDALPMDLTVAQPTELKSTGYNQWNPANVIAHKTITENAIVDGDKSIAIVECLPCKVGAGENNGYIIGYGEGDGWSDEGVEVYLSPLNPMEVEGELYMHKLEIDVTYSTYVPQIKGYLLVVTPTTDKLCAHLHWSGDRAKTDYEEYVESNVVLPAIPEMSEWGLAGVNSAQDTIDLENNKFTKRVGCVDMGTMAWLGSTKNFRALLPTGAKKTGKIQLSCSAYIAQPAVYYKETYTNTDLTNIIFPVVNDNNIVVITSKEYATNTDFKNDMQGVMLYYELAEPEEYPIVTKTAPNYIGSDYGVEEFTGSKVPLAANILFYMRSLVSETRNFLDRLMAGLGVSDVTSAADKIIAAILPSETVGEDTELNEAGE